jgi:argininosuccinate synthase
VRRIALAYSGGLAASVALTRLKDQGAEVVTVTCDVGQAVDLEMVRDRALSLGAARAHVLDVKEAFARDIVMPALRADARLGGILPLPAALARPIVAQKLLEIAAIERADAVAHGASRTEAPAPIDTLLTGLDPARPIVAPIAQGKMTRDVLRAFARQRQWPFAADASWSLDSTLWGRSIAWCGDGEMPAVVPDDVFAPARQAAPHRDTSAILELAFERGRPVAVNGVTMPLLDLIASLTTIAAAYGIGRVQRPPDTSAAADGLQAVQAPAAVLLHAGHNELAGLARPHDLAAFASAVAGAYASIVVEGRWFSPLREALDRFVDAADNRTSGIVQFTLARGEFSPARAALGDAGALQHGTH